MGEWTLGLLGFSNTNITEIIRSLKKIKATADFVRYTSFGPTPS